MSFKEIAAYSLGLFGFQAIVGLLNSYQAEFDGSILGANVSVVAILILVAKIVSAVADPVVGNLVDRSKKQARQVQVNDCIFNRSASYFYGGGFR
ncbi:MAG: MFS transporter [Eubacterium sp.]